MVKKKTNKLLLCFCGVLFFLVGACGGIVGNIYLSENYFIPPTEENTSTITAGDINVEEIKSKELSIHFIELGNKYTGECTLIKVGSTEILIDAGSRASSVEPIYDYVSGYVEGKLDYIVVTHAHRDHYAGLPQANMMIVCSRSLIATR